MNSMQPAHEAGAEEATDKRFAGHEWDELPVFRYFRDSYLLTSKMMMEAVEGANLDAPTKQRMRFFMRQYLDAAAPSNYLMTNPEALKAAMESRGETLQEGMKNLLADMEKGRISMTDESAFEVGRNIAVTPGAVVYENDLIQLIQYRPTTAKVHERPLVMVPPCINKFYIMDLQPENSLVRYAVEQGHTVFMMSWRNVKKEHSRTTWDDYLEALLDALEEAKRIGKSAKVNALGFCIGGTLLASALAVLERKGRNPVESLTLLTTLLEFSEVGDIRVYIDENFVDKREKQLEKGGIVPGQELAGAFSSLRANDLVWSYVVNNYLKGKQPPAFDLLYWNHIVPWRGGYASARTLGGKVKFVLGASGHIAGTINPASKSKRSYWTNDKLTADADKWFVEAKELPGSWWREWSQWLKPHGGKMASARKKLGDGRRKPIEPAPGRYAKERV